MPVDELRDWRHVVWDDRLLSRHRAADMSGTWGIKIDYPYLRCGQCDMNIMMLPRDGKLISVDGLMSAVVRHMVMSKHGYVLSGAPQGGSNGSPD